jgi:Spy/CpxP family protein refolding chaperone
MNQDNAPPPAPSLPGSALRRPKRRVWLATALGAVILICGMAIGSGGTILWIRHKMEQFRRGPNQMHVELADRVRVQLNLTDDQTKRIEEILKKRHEALMKLHRETFKSELEGMRAEVATVLTPEQAKKWNDDYESIMRIPPFPPPPGGPPPHGGPPPAPPDGDRHPPGPGF